MKKKFIKADEISEFVSVLAEKILEGEKGFSAEFSIKRDTKGVYWFRTEIRTPSYDLLHAEEFEVFEDVESGYAMAIDVIDEANAKNETK